jgi:hypothetical protein
MATQELVEKIKEYCNEEITENEATLNSTRFFPTDGTETVIEGRTEFAKAILAMIDSSEVK